MGRERVVSTAWICVFFVLICTTSVFGIDVPAKLKGIPLYEGSKIQHAMDMGNAAVLGATTKAKAAAVADFYRKALVEKGWKTIFQMQSENGQVIHFQKGNEVCHINFEENEDGTTFNIVLSSS